jgi:hypothetical protein
MLSKLFKARRRAKAASIFGRLPAHINRMNRPSNVGAQTLGPCILPKPRSSRFQPQKNRKPAVKMQMNKEENYEIRETRNHGVGTGRTGHPKRGQDGRALRHAAVERCLPVRRVTKCGPVPQQHGAGTLTLRRVECLWSLHAASSIVRIAPPLWDPDLRARLTKNQTNRHFHPEK